jgi:hypothetical protein
MDHDYENQQAVRAHVHVGKQGTAHAPNPWGAWERAMQQQEESAQRDFDIMRGLRLAREHYGQGWPGQHLAWAFADTQGVFDHEPGQMAARAFGVGL